MVHKFGSQWWGGIRDILPGMQRNTKKRKENKIRKIADIAIFG